jgi:hypothetical protein
MAVFINGKFLDGYDEKILKASNKSEIPNLSDDKLEAAIENLFDAFITRSKILDLYEKCGREAGKLYEHG